MQQGGHERGVHVFVPHPGDDAQFRQHHHHGDGGGGLDVRDEIRQGVAKPAEHGHQPANESARPRMAASGQAAVVGQRLGESHADARAHGGGQSDEKGGRAAVRGERGGEQRRERGDGAVHEPGESGLDDLQDEQPLGAGLFVLAQFGRGDLLGGDGVVAFLFGEVAEELADAGVGGAAAGGLVKAAGFHLHVSAVFWTVFKPSGRMSQTGLRSTKPRTSCRRMSGTWSPKRDL